MANQKVHPHSTFYYNMTHGIFVLKYIQYSFSSKHGEVRTLVLPDKKNDHFPYIFLNKNRLLPLIDGFHRHNIHNCSFRTPVLL